MGSDSLEKERVKRRSFHAPNLMRKVSICFFFNHAYILHAKLSAVELNFLGGGGSLYEYNIVKTMKYICASVTLYVRYKVTSNQ